MGKLFQVFQACLAVFYYSALPNVLFEQRSKTARRRDEGCEENWGAGFEGMKGGHRYKESL